MSVVEFVTAVDERRPACPVGARTSRRDGVVVETIDPRRALPLPVIIAARVALVLLALATGAAVVAMAVLLVAGGAA